MRSGQSYAGKWNFPKIKCEWVCNSTYSSDLLSYTNGSREGFVEFCVIEVFKFWVMLRWMKE